jgi:hypothetical protein
VGIALVLRLWGIRHGLPLIFNSDEAGHFVPPAIEFFRSGYEPGYYVNPPGFTYFLHLVFAVYFGGGDGALEAWVTLPSKVYLLGRVSSALLGTVAVALLYFVGRRLFDARVGATAAAVLAVAFLPVFFGHEALNDSPQLAPLVFSLLGTAGILTRGRPLDYAVAGFGLGLAAGFKYPSGMVLIPLLTAVAARLLTHEDRRATAQGLGIASVAGVAAFLISVPGVFLEPGVFLDDIQRLSVTSQEVRKLGQSQESGMVYYLWTLTWGIGWLPSLFAVIGAILLAHRWRAAAAVLVPAPILFLFFMGSQHVFFGRYLIPILPFVALLAAYAVGELAQLVAAGHRRSAEGVAVVGLIALTVQGFVHSVHTDLVLTRDDTREIARRWMVENIPKDTLVVFEPIAPSAWLAKPRPRLARKAGWSPGTRHARWKRYDIRHALNDLLARGSVQPEDLPGDVAFAVRPPRYVEYLRPALLAEYVRDGACWVVTGSNQSGRASSDRRAPPTTIAYYRLLDSTATRVFHVDPYDEGAKPVPFNYDWSSNFYPLSYERPGPEVDVFRLEGGRC